LAAELVREFNQLHTAGYDLQGDLGLDFFAPLDVSVVIPSTNQGGAAATTQEILDPSLLTLDDYEIRFTDSSNYEIVNTTRGSVVGTGAYTSGGPIEFEGLRIVIEDQTGGPAAGDRFEVSVAQDMARDIQVNVQDGSRIAAAQDPNAIPGDNRNALALAGLRDASVVDGGRTTFGGFYQSLVARVGAEVQDAARKADAGEAVYESMMDYRNSISGVSLEEEEIRLLAYQHAYQAAAKFLTVVDDLMDTLLAL
jgi:flagellar hook-associated protein 1 FlgK